MRNRDIFILSIFLLLLQQSCQEKKYDHTLTSEERIGTLSFKKKEFFKKGISVKVLESYLTGEKLSESWLIETKADKYFYYNIQYNQKGDTIVKKYFQINKNNSFYDYGWGYYNYEDGRYEFKQYYPLKDQSIINQFKLYNRGKLIKDSSSYYRIVDVGSKRQIILESSADDAILLLSEKLLNDYSNFNQIQEFDTLYPIRFEKPFIWEIPKNIKLRGIIKIIKYNGKPYYDKEKKDYIQKVSERDMYLGEVNTIESLNKIDKKLLW